jgi:hypothetical protein
MALKLQKKKKRKKDCRGLFKQMQASLQFHIVISEDGGVDLELRRGERLQFKPQGVKAPSSVVHWAF